MASYYGADEETPARVVGVLHVELVEVLLLREDDEVESLRRPTSTK